MATKERFLFCCGRWLDRREDNGEIIRELPAEGNGITPLPGVYVYIQDWLTGYVKAYLSRHSNLLDVNNEC